MLERLLFLLQEIWCVALHHKGTCTVVGEREGKIEVAAEASAMVVDDALILGRQQQQQQRLRKKEKRIIAPTVRYGLAPKGLPDFSSSVDLLLLLLLLLTLVIKRLLIIIAGRNSYLLLLSNESGP